MLPFTHEQFLAVFAAYNLAVWPAQVAAYLIACGVLVAVALRLAWSGMASALALALFWAWTGVAYHAKYFSAINPAGMLFAGLFVAQALVLLGWAWRHAPRLRFGADAGRIVGAGLLAYALVAYPLLGSLLGYRYPAAPTFGVTPCPVALFTFGVLLLAEGRLPWWLLAIPVAWSVVGGSAAFLLHVPQDWVLLASGPAMAIFSVRFGGHRARTPSAGAHRAPR